MYNKDTYYKELVMTLHITHGEDKEILIESLLETIKLKNKQVADARNDARNDIVAASLLRRFLVDIRPDLTDELCKFVMDGSQHERYYEDFYNGALCALEYHRDSIDNSNLEASINELEELAGK